MEYLGDQVPLAGLEAHPKYLGSLVNIPFPRTLRSMQSVLESLNYYSRFIEDFAIYESVLCKLREADFHEIRRMDEAESSTRNGKRADDRKCLGDHDPNPNSVTGTIQRIPVLLGKIRTVTVLQGTIQRIPAILGRSKP